MFSVRWMGTFEGLCRNPARSKMAGSNWLQTDEAVDVIFCDLHVKKGFCSNLRASRSSSAVKMQVVVWSPDWKMWPWLLTVMSCFIVVPCQFHYKTALCGYVMQFECIRRAYSLLKRGCDYIENRYFKYKDGGTKLTHISSLLLLLLLYSAQHRISRSHFCIVICAVLGEVGPQMAVYCCK